MRWPSPSSLLSLAIALCCLSGAALAQIPGQNASYPGLIYNALSVYVNPTTIPQNGYLTAVVEYSSNCTGSVNMYYQISDPSKSYALAGGQMLTVPTPSYGSLQFTLSPFRNLNATDVYLLTAAYLCTSTSNANGGSGNDYLLWTPYYYGPVTVQPLPAGDSLTMYNPPTTIPSTGVITVYARWSSNYVGYVSLHLDLTDVSEGYVGDGNSYLNVSSPGSGVVIFSINITAAGGANLTDNVILDYYLTYGNYTTAAGPGNDYLHQAASGQFGVTVVPASSLVNSVIITGTATNPGTVAAPKPPTLIPLSGTFTINLAWQTRVSGVVNVHVDISDVSRNYLYDGGMTTQIVGPGAGTVQFVMSYNAVSNITAGDNYQLHVYLTPENNSYVYGAATDYMHVISEIYYPVTVGTQTAPAANATYPGLIYNALSVYVNPTTIPQNGYLTAVVEYSSNCTGSVNMYYQISDPSKSYALAGGQMLTVPTPSYGSLQFTLSPFRNLNATDVYLLTAAYLCTSTSNANGGSGNDYLLWTPYYYGPVTVQPLPAGDSLTMYNPPTTIPSTGVITVYARWSSNYVGYVSLHLDLTDVSEGYVGDGNSYLNVSSPGSGVVIFSINITAAGGANLTDNVILDYYLTYGNYTTAAGPGNDYLHQAASGQFGVTVVPASSLVNSVIITGTATNPGTVAAPKPPTLIPLSGTFTINLAWQTRVSGVVNVHVDISDVSRNYLYDGGMTTQIVGPGAGTVQFVMSYNAVSNITAGDNYQLHVYLTPENNSYVYGAATDYMHVISEIYYPVTVGTQTAPAANATYPGLIYNALSVYVNPTTIPQNGYLTAVVEYSSNCTGSVNMYYQISDPSKSYALAGGQMLTVPTPSYGSLQFTLSPFRNLNATDVYLLTAAYLCTSTSNANGGSGNDYLLWTPYYYGPVTVQPLPAGDSLTMYNPPTTIPSTGVITVYARWSSNYVGYVSLHLDLTDVSEGYVGDGNSYLNVSSPGSGVVIFSINITAAGGANLTDNVILDYYLTYGNYTTAAGPGNDYLHQAASGQFGVTVVPASSLVNSVIITGTATNPGTVAAPKPPTLIPLSGTFTINLAWQTRVSGVVNVHVDISDVSRNYLYDGGMTTQIVGPGAGTVQFVMSYNAVSNITAGDNYQLHVYLTPENNSYVYGAATDYMHVISEIYYPVTVGTQTAPAANASYPGLIYNAVSSYLNPQTIPANGYLTAVVEYSSNCTGSGVNVHYEISDPEKSYLLAGGQTKVVATPSYGSLQFTLSPFRNLNVSDTYLLAVFTACTDRSNANGGTGNDYLIESSVYYYGPVTVQPLPAGNSLTLYNPPTTIPSTGVITVYAYWSSNYVGYVSLHLDLTDVTEGYVGDGNSYLNVSSPGSGVVAFVISISAAGGASMSDNVILDYYLTYGNYTTAAGPGNDYLHQAASGQFGVTVVPASSLVNSVIITGTATNPGTVAAPKPPTLIPLSGTFTINLAWQTRVSGVVNVHVDISDVSRNYLYDGGMTTQIVGPGAGTVQFVMSYNAVSNITAGDNYQLHVYLTPENNSYVYGAATDYMHVISEIYYPVTVGTQTAPAANASYPGLIYNAVSSYLNPQTIPANGYLTAVVEYSSNCTGSGVNVHYEISDPEKSYLLAGGQTKVVATPSYGSLQFTLSPFRNLNVSDTYLLAVFTACTDRSNANGGTGNDYLIESSVYYYGPVTVQPLPAGNSLTLYNPPTTIPSTGVITVYAYWSSNYVGYVSLHLDLTDVTEGYVGDGNSYLNVSSPGSGVVAFVISISAAGGASMSDNVILDYYLTYGNYTTAAGPGNDYLHQAASGQFGVTVVPASSLVNSVIITGTATNPGTVAAPKPPTLIPLSGTFTINLAWQTRVSGVVNVHVDISDVSRNYLYDGGMTTQIVGPGAGTVQFVMSYNAVSNITAGDNYQLHVYLTPENNSYVYGAATDYMHVISEIYYPVTAGTQTAPAANASYPGLIYNAVSSYLNPQTIPANGYLTAVVEYSSNCTGSGVNVHYEISDPEKSYLLAGGQTKVVATPSYGSLQFTLSPFRNLNVSDTYLLAVFTACTDRSNANGGTGNDYLIESSVYYYGPVTVQPLPAGNSLTLYNPPTTIPSTGVITVYAYWSSNYVGYVSLHLDLTDVTEGYVGDGNSYLNVSSPGSGVVAFVISISAAGGASMSDNVILDYYLTYGNYTTAAGPGNDYLHQAASGQFGVTVVPASSLVNSVIITGTATNPGTVAAPKPPTLIPLSGTFTINLAWQTRVSGVVNVHVDISDVSRNYLYDGGMTTQIVGPGAGTVQFVMSYNAVSNITAGDNYQLHVYLTPENNTQVYGPYVDYQHPIYENYYPVTVGNPNVNAGGGSSSSSSSGLSGGAIAGIVIGSLAGAIILLAVLLVMYSRRDRGMKLDKHTGGDHQPHHDEPSHAGESVEMGEVHEEETGHAE